MPQLLPETVAAVREKIESGALEHFVRQGYAGTTTRQIATKAGLTAGAIYSHYPSKEALFAAVTRRSQQALSSDDNPIIQVLRRQRFPFDLLELAAAIRDLVRDHRDYWLLWYVDVIEFGGSHFQPMLAPQVMLRLPELQERFDELRREGSLKIPPETAFIMIYMQLFNYFIVEQIFGGNQHFGVAEDQAVGAIVDTFLQGALAPAGGAQ
jgi:AcrR family transcriptional regulator